MPDIIALIKLNYSRKTPAQSGYRPAHKILEDYYTTGVHHYIGTDWLEPGGETLGTITFLSPEHYPHSLIIGQTLEIYEGSKIVGEITVIEIQNELLMRKGNPPIISHIQK